MDINLTTPIAANVSLMQPWYITVISAGAGIIGVFVGGIISLISVNTAQKHNENILKNEARRYKRDELKKIYIELITATEKMSTGNVDGDHLVKSLTEVLMLGDKDVSNSVGSIWNEYLSRPTDLQERTKMVYRIYQEVVPLMRTHLSELEKD